MKGIAAFLQHATAMSSSADGWTFEQNHPERERLIREQRERDQQVAETYRLLQAFPPQARA